MNHVSKYYLTLKIVGRKIKFKTVKSSKIHFVDIAESTNGKVVEKVKKYYSHPKKIMEVYKIV